MHRVFTISIAVSFFLAVGSMLSPKETTSAGTMTAQATSVPATQQPASAPVTLPAEEQPDLPTGWPGQLEIITPQNWGRLQLVKTFPAEMPMNRSAATFVPDGKTIVMGSNTSAKLFFFDLESGRLTTALVINGVKNANTPFKTIAYLADGTIMANSDRPYTVYHIDPMGNVLSAWNSIYFAVSADEKILAFDVNEGTIVVDDAEETPIALLKNSNGYGFSFSPDNTRIAINAVTEDYANVDIWEIKSQTIIKTLPDMYNVTYSPNGKFLAMLDANDGSLKAFTADDITLITAIQSARSGYLISPDSSILAYQTVEGPSVAMDTSSWKPVETTLRGELYAFSPDGRILMTRTDEGGMLIWGVPISAG
jgi:WD40 repeat protein